MYLYKITNTISNTIYIGITKRNVNTRFSQHKYAAKNGTKSKLYCAMRSYGIEHFKIETLQVFKTYEQLLIAEEFLIRYIKAANIKNYNIKDGGSRVFGIDDIESWKNNLKQVRKGKKLALGMKHSDDNKKLFGAYGRLRWDIHGRYPIEVLNYSFKDANKKYGISKTHYYRLRKERVLSNE